MRYNNNRKGKGKMNKWYIVSKLTCICALAVIVAVFAK